MQYLPKMFHIHNVRQFWSPELTPSPVPQLKTQDADKHFTHMLTEASQLEIYPL